MSPKELALALGVSESSIKRWVDGGDLEASRTVGGHRKIAASEAVRFARGRGMELVRPEMLGLPGLPPAARGREGADAATLLLELLRLGRGEDAAALLLNLYTGGRSIAEIADGPLCTAMEEIGTLWRHDETGVAQEHRATDACIHAVNRLRALIPAPATNGSGPTAVGGAPSGDPYLLPTLAAACTLTDSGYRVAHLGPDTPFVSLLHAAEAVRAKLIWVSCSATQSPMPPRKAWAALAADAARLGASLVVGGRSVPPDLQTPDRRPANLFVCDTMRELAAFAEGLRGRSRASR